ncbi:DivIVA domain-containing protein [Desulfopila aestuarii]|uniref:DivIVA domain-containing protein n=1 Tax=Desulfopila aestuarii DSM 18488 TaxID=1121416 RepID=A0A1M7Y2U3_9BACT|nr:DivIVA domain-containing protein [Desulfopila aestuarii]SHO46238.1 DivIVA domain-containing protein [Desulfopila aestuarii DSM 18488]
MSITPQAIKDQEFQVKFRGYDTIEVKAYLELLAEEFFELHEVRRRQEDEYAELYEEVQALKEERENLVEESRQREERSEKSVIQFLEKDEMIVELQKQIASLEEQVAASDQEKNLQQEAWGRQEAELREEIEQLRGRLAENQSDASDNSGEVEKLRGQIELLEKQVAEFKKEEVDFKTALVAAQRFADDVKNKAKEEADQMLEQAISEVEIYRKEAEQELANLPVEIEQLRSKKAEVREELKAVLTFYLKKLDFDPAEAAGGSDDDLSELFQSIPLGEDEGLEPMEVEGFESK